MNTPDIPPIDLVTLQQRHEEARRPSYRQFMRLVKARGLVRGAQVGVGFGGLCESLLDYRGIDSLIGIDAYQPIADVEDERSTDLCPRDLERVYRAALDRLARFGHRFDLIREPAWSASHRVADASLDFVYFHANPTRPDAGPGAWVDKVCNGGVIAGYDARTARTPDTPSAVEGFFRRLGWPVNRAGDGVWWVQKQALPISFVIPAYNAEQTLWQAAVSVIEGNLCEADELIIIDDGSTDATAQVIDTLVEAYPGVRVIRQAQNLGAGAARNRAINEATHELVFMLDADNVLATESVASLRRHLIANSADAVCFGEVRLFRDGDEPSQTAWTHRYPAGQASFEQYCAMQDPPAAAGNLLLTRDAWRRADGYPEHAGALDSWGFGLRLVANHCVVAVCHDGYYDHRIGHDSYWQREAQPGKTDRLAWSILRPFIDRLSAESRLYLLQNDNQQRWFNDLPKRPLRTKDAPRKGRIPAWRMHALRERLAKLVSRAA
ncbi:MAG: glycosyltransferase family 2 protein [Phycisphaeraceae bacterium]